MDQSPSPPDTPTAATPYALVQDALTGLELPVTHQDDAEEVLVVDDHERGLAHLVLVVEDPILVLEMPVLPLAPERLEAPFLTDVLRWNRELAHGAFALNEGADLLLWRDTLALENLTAADIESSIHALEIALAEHAGKLLDQCSGGRPQGGDR